MITTPVPDGDRTRETVQSPDAAADERCLMAELAIIRGVRHYFYDGYSYDRLSDAVAYAQLVQGHTHR